MLNIEPNSVEAYDYKGCVLYELNELEEAAQCSSKAIELDPFYANGWYNRSRYMTKKGQINEVLRNLKEAIRLNNAYLESARTDKDFDSSRNDERFKKLIGD